MPEEQTRLHINTNLTNLKQFKKFGTRGGTDVEKAKTFIIFVLTITLFATYFMLYNLWMDNRVLKNKINDLESTVRVYQIIEKTGKNGG